MVEDAEKIFQEAENETEDLYSYIREAAEFFHSNEGKMFKRREARETLKEELEVSTELANRLIGELVEDQVDPVVQVNTEKGRFVGVAEYREFKGAYGYKDYDDVLGEQKKVVCARCVELAENDSEVAHAVSEKSDVSYEELNQKIKNHYSNMHKAEPEAVKTGATLAAGTTVGGNRVATRNWVKDSGDADQVDGYDVQKDGSDGSGVINFKT